MPSEAAEIEAARRAFLHEIAEEIRQGNSDWVIGPTLTRATKAALEAAERARWQPIETAPKDREILVFCPAPNSLMPDYQFTAMWSDRDGCFISWGGEKLPFTPTHWQLLSSPLKNDTQGS